MLFLYHTALPSLDAKCGNNLQEYSTLHFRLRLLRQMGKIQFRRIVGGTIRCVSRTGLLYAGRDRIVGITLCSILSNLCSALHSYLVTTDDILSLLRSVT